MSPARRNILLLASFWVAALAPISARAQLGTGGVGATLTKADVFISVQKEEGVNLTELNRGRFLNLANCRGKTPVWVKAVVVPAAAARAALIPPSATVSMYLGNNCESATTIGCCIPLKDMPFSQFRLTGLTQDTTVDVLARIWSNAPGQCNDGSAVPPVGTGGASGAAGTGGAAGGAAGAGTGGTAGAGTGGAAGATTGAGGATTGAGGAAGADGTAEVSGAAGANGSGGAAGTGDPAAPGKCEAKSFGQTLWIFIGTSGRGTFDILSSSLGFQVDPEAPISPTGVVVSPVNEALVVGWTPISTADVADLMGYQVLCTRNAATPVFTGAYAASFDTYPTTSSTGWPISSEFPQTSFACSPLLSAAANSYRVKVLENGVTYNVGVAAIDKQWNASIIQPQPGVPIETKDFYRVYRDGAPGGGATGGFCAISGDAADAGSTRVLAGLGVIATIGLIVARTRRGRRRRP